MRTIGLSLLLLISANCATVFAINWVGYQDGCGGQILQPFDASFHDGNQWFNFLVPQSGQTASFDLDFDPQENGMPTNVHFGDFHVNTIGVGCMDADIPAADATVGLVEVTSGFFNFELEGRQLTTQQLHIIPSGPFPSLLVTGGILEIPMATDTDDTRVFDGQLTFTGSDTIANLHNGITVKSTFGSPLANVTIENGATLNLLDSDNGERPFLSVGFLSAFDSSFTVDGNGTHMLSDIEMKGGTKSLLEIQNGATAKMRVIETEGRLRISGGAEVTVEEDEFISGFVAAVDGLITGPGTLLTADKFRSVRLPIADQQNSMVVADQAIFRTSTSTIDVGDELQVNDNGVHETGVLNLSGLVSVASGGEVIAPTSRLFDGSMVTVSGTDSVFRSNNQLLLQAGNFTVSSNGRFEQDTSGSVEVNDSSILTFNSGMNLSGNLDIVSSWTTPRDTNNAALILSGSNTNLMAGQVEIKSRLFSGGTEGNNAFARISDGAQLFSSGLSSPSGSSGIITGVPISGTDVTTEVIVEDDSSVWEQDGALVVGWSGCWSGANHQGWRACRKRSWSCCEAFRFGG